MKAFTRKELQKIENRAILESQNCANGAWIRALQRLADCANCLNAMISRSTEDCCDAEGE